MAVYTGLLPFYPQQPLYFFTVHSLSPRLLNNILVYTRLFYASIYYDFLHNLYNFAMRKIKCKIHNINDSLMTVKFKKYFMKNKHISEYRWHSRQK